MTTVWDDFTEEDFQLFDSAARGLRKRAQGLMDFDDLYQSAALWALEHRREWDKARAESNGFAVGKLKGVLSNLIRQEKAKREGYELDDQFAYSPKVLKKVIPLAFDPTWMEQAQEYSTEPKKRGGDPADPANAWVLVADVKQAFPRLRDQDRLLLYRTLVGPGEYSQVCREIAVESGVETRRVQVAVSDALRRLGRLLRSER